MGKEKRARGHAIYPKRTRRNGCLKPTKLLKEKTCTMGPRKIQLRRSKSGLFFRKGKRNLDKDLNNNKGGKWAAARKTTQTPKRGQLRAGDVCCAPKNEGGRRVFRGGATSQYSSGLRGEGGGETEKSTRPRGPRKKCLLGLF